MRPLAKSACGVTGDQYNTVCNPPSPNDASAAKDDASSGGIGFLLYKDITKKDFEMLRRRLHKAAPINHFTASLNNERSVLIDMFMLVTLYL